MEGREGELGLSAAASAAEAGGRAEEAYRVFFEAVVQGGIAPLAEAAYELLGKPVVVADGSAGLILQRPDVDLDIPSWMELRREGAIRYENYLKAVDDYHRINMPANEPVVVRDLQLYDGVMVAVRFCHRGELVGYVYLMFGQDEPDEEELDIVRILARALQPELARLFVLGKDQDEQLAVACERGKGSSRDRQAALTALRKRYEGGFRLLYVETRRKNSPGILPRARRSINSGAYNAAAVDFEDGLVVLLHRLMPGVTTVDQVLRALSSYAVVGALSLPFDDLSLIADYLVQARATLASGRIVDAERQFFRYEDVVPLQPFAVCAEQADMSVFVHPAVRKMIAHDEAHGTEMLKTLETYLSLQRKKTQTAEALSIHLNTLSYRLGRMEELFGIDFDDAELMAEIQVSLLACKFLKD